MNRPERGESLEDFETVYREYYDVVYRYLCALCRDAGWAEELTQAAFVKALQKIGSFRGECKLRVWLCQVAKNTYYSALRRKRPPPEPALPEDSPEQQLEDKEAAFKAHQLLHQLDPVYKEVFWMRAFGELSFREIGALFDKTENWARVTYYRAKTKIREGMNDV